MKHVFLMIRAALCGVALGATAQTIGDNAAQPSQRTELQRQVEQLRLRSSQSNDLARNADQSAANEDRLAQTGPNWARLVHQVAALKFRDQAAKLREAAQQYLTQAQEMERKLNEMSKSSAALVGEERKFVPSSTGPPASGDEYLTVTDELQVEGAIEAYLNRNGIKATKVVGNNGAIHFVQVGFLGGNGQPNLVYRITALAPIVNGNGVRFQLIGFTLETNIKASSVNESLYAALGEANKVGNCAWFVDGGEIRCRSWLSIPGPTYPVPAELVKQKIEMINSEWSRSSPQILAASK
jgi:hypothetical protein